jgi:hypothetical protein
MSMKVLVFYHLIALHYTAKHSTQKSLTYAITHWKFVVDKVTVYCNAIHFKFLGNARGGKKVVNFWLHLHQNLNKQQ